MWYGTGQAFPAGAGDANLSSPGENGLSCAMGRPTDATVAGHHFGSLVVSIKLELRKEKKKRMFPIIWSQRNYDKEPTHNRHGQEA